MSNVQRPKSKVKSSDEDSGDRHATLDHIEIWTLDPWTLDLRRWIDLPAGNVAA